MNRTVLIALIAVLVIGGGYYQFSYKPAQEAAATAAAEAQKAADEAAAATKAAADEAAAAAKKAEEEAAAAAKKAADDAAAAAAAAGTAAADAVTAAADAVTAAGDAVAAAGDAMALLVPAAWDAVKVNAMIAASSLDAATKATLTGLVDAAGADTVKIGEAITAIKTALGL